MISAGRVICIILFSLVWARPVVSEPLERSVSTSRQFLVYGGDVRLRGVICDLAERTKQDLLQLLDKRDGWITPIVINAQYPKANLPEMPRSALHFSQTGFGLKLQLDLTIRPDANLMEVRREILRAILLELMYQDRPDLPAGTAVVLPPNWLMDGIPARDRDPDWGKFLDALVTTTTMTRKIPSLKDCLRSHEISDLDRPSRLLHSAYSIVLLEFLVQLPDGRGRLARFIRDLASTSPDSVIDLGSYFPELRSGNSAEKAWVSHVERLASRQPAQLLSVEETERKLSEFLFLTISDGRNEKRYSLDQFPQFVRNPGSKSNLVRLSRDLSVLATRANPICQSAVCEYATIGALLARRKTKGIARRLASLANLRRELIIRAREISDYLNWIEATKPQVLSGAFADYLAAEKRVPKPDRHDCISIYLDAIETEFQN